MQWKFEAEEGSAFIRVPAFYGALGLLGTSIYVLSTVADARIPEKIVMSTCVITMALFIKCFAAHTPSSNPKLPKMLAEAGIVFMGPSERAMWLLGDKIGEDTIWFHLGIDSTILEE